MGDAVLLADMLAHEREAMVMMSRERTRAVEQVRGLTKALAEARRARDIASAFLLLVALLFV